MNTLFLRYHMSTLCEYLMKHMYVNWWITTYNILRSQAAWNLCQAFFILDLRLIFPLMQFCHGSFASWPLLQASKLDYGHCQTHMWHRAWVGSIVLFATHVILTSYSNKSMFELTCSFLCTCDWRRQAAKSTWQHSNWLQKTAHHTPGFDWSYSVSPDILDNWFYS